MGSWAHESGLNKLFILSWRPYNAKQMIGAMGLLLTKEILSVVGGLAVTVTEVITEVVEGR